MFSQEYKIVEQSLLKIGIELTDEYDGFIVKKLKASNTLDLGRTTNQTHIAITGEQMDIFPYVRSLGYFDVSYSNQDADLKNTTYCNYQFIFIKPTLNIWVEILIMKFKRYMQAL